MFYEGKIVFGILKPCVSFTGTFKVKIMLRDLLKTIPLTLVSFELSLLKPQANKNNCLILQLWFLNQYVTQNIHRTRGNILSLVSMVRFLVKT